MGSNEPTQAVDVTDTIDIGVDSLRAHDAYLTGPGASLGVRHAVAFGRVHLQGV